MTEKTECASCDYSVTNFKTYSKMFIYTWKINNFRKIVNEEMSNVTSESNSASIENSSFWAIKLGALQSCTLSMEVSFKEFVAHNYFQLKVALIDASEIEREVYCTKKLQQFPIKIQLERNSLLNKDSDLLPRGNLTLKFYLTFTKWEFLTTNSTAADFSNMLITNELESMFNNEKFSDFKIDTNDDASFHVHKVILASRSEYFAAMFEHDTKENKENCMKIMNFDHKIVHDLLLFLYSNKVADIKKVAYDLLPAADMYQIESLRFMCEKALIEQLKVENVMALLGHAEKYGATLLKKSALQYFNSHLKEITKTKTFENDLNNINKDLVPELFKCI